MDWRTGKPNSTGSAFRGISTRGRGRGRGRGAPTTGRGGYNAPVEPAPSIPPPVSTGTQESPTLNLPPRPKSASRRGSHLHARRAPSLSHLDIPKPSASTTEQQTTVSTPQIPRRASHTPLGSSQNDSNPSKLQIPSVKLDLSSPTTPSSPRSKPTRKRSQNRTRSSSKASTQDRLSAAASTTSLKEKEKELPPHLSLASAPPDVQSFDLRTNIDTLVERVRAMAMAGSAVDRDKDKDGQHTYNEGHIDWAGDDDDTLPDLDDWVRPKSAEPKNLDAPAEGKASDKIVLSPVDEASPSLPCTEQEEQTKKKIVAPDGAKEVDEPQRVEEVKEDKQSKAINEVMARDKESTSSRTKSRGKHNRKKANASESSSPGGFDSLPATRDSVTDSVKRSVTDSLPLSTPKFRSPLVHPLPPKPQSTLSPARGPKPRAAPQTLPVAQPPIHLSEATTQELPPPAVAPSEEKPPPGPPIELVESIINVENHDKSPQPAKKATLHPAVDWANAPRPSSTPATEVTSDIKDNVHSSNPSLEPQTEKRTFDSSVDWANARRPPKRSSPTRSSPAQGISPSKRGRPFSPPSVSHPHTPLSHEHPQGLFHTFRNASPPVFPDFAYDAPHPPQARTQVNSPNLSPRRWPNREGLTHVRSHSSPQTGPGTRAHTSRPVITLDAISRISRTLGASQTTTPSHGQAVGVAVNE